MKNMNEKKILSKAIDRAIKNGWKWDDHIDCYCSCCIIFQQSFAKAFWGEKIEVFDFESINDAWNDNCYGFGGKLTYSYAEGGAIKYEGECWKYHLQKMILEENPVGYLEQFL